MTPERPLLACACCGYLTITDTYDSCGICAWVHDEYQEAQPDDDAGPNYIALRNAQENFRLFGACDKKYVASVKPAGPDDVRDPAWKPLKQGNAGE